MKINSKVTKYQMIIFFKKKAKKFKDEIRKQNKKNQRKKIEREMLYCSYE
jgi:hypothetical protein